MTEAAKKKNKPKVNIKNFNKRNLKESDTSRVPKVSKSEIKVDK